MQVDTPGIFDINCITIAPPTTPDVINTFTSVLRSSHTMTNNSGICHILYNWCIEIHKSFWLFAWIKVVCNICVFIPFPCQWSPGQPVSEPEQKCDRFYRENKKSFEWLIHCYCTMKHRNSVDVFMSLFAISSLSDNKIWSTQVKVLEKSRFCFGLMISPTDA